MYVFYYFTLIEFFKNGYYMRVRVFVYYVIYLLRDYMYVGIVYFNRNIILFLIYQPVRHIWRRLEENPALC